MRRSHGPSWEALTNHLLVVYLWSNLWISQAGTVLRRPKEEINQTQHSSAYLLTVSLTFFTTILKTLPLCLFFLLLNCLSLNNLFWCYVSHIQEMLGHKMLSKLNCLTEETLQGQIGWNHEPEATSTRQPVWAALSAGSRAASSAHSRHVIF